MGDRVGGRWPRFGGRRRTAAVVPGAVLAAVILIGGCGDEPRSSDAPVAETSPGAPVLPAVTGLPDRGDPAVRAAEEALARRIEQGDPSEPSSCEVRLLGVDGVTSYAWATCSGDPGWAWSMPMRIDDAGVQGPGDGDQYVDDVRAMFPRKLSEQILGNPQALQP